MVDLAIVIVNYNTCDLLRDCLKSIYDSRGDFNFAVIVVDNASSDNSVLMGQTEFPQAQIIASPVNGGFAYANNLGLRRVGFNDKGSPLPSAPRYALLLNPDTILPPTALVEMISFMDQHPEVGATGPKLVRLDGSLDLACRRSFPTPTVSLYRMIGLSKLFPHHHRFGRYNMTFADPDELTEVDAIVGAFMLVRREAIAQAGLLDETYFMYGEDLDWAYRIKAEGWKIYYNPAVTVTHVKRAASQRSPKAQVEFYRAMDIFYRKFYADSTPFWLHSLVVSGITLLWKSSQLKYKLLSLIPAGNNNSFNNDRSAKV